MLQSLKEPLLLRCSPPTRGGLKALFTGNVILTAVSSWHKNHGISFSENQHCAVEANSVRGPPWKAQSVLDFKDSLAKAQAKSKVHPVKRAYQLTHDDVASVMRRYVSAQLGAALEATRCSKLQKDRPSTGFRYRPR